MKTSEYIDAERRKNQGKLATAMPLGAGGENDPTAWDQWYVYLLDLADEVSVEEEEDAHDVEEDDEILDDD